MPYGGIQRVVTLNTQRSKIIQHASPSDDYKDVVYIAPDRFSLQPDFVVVQLKYLYIQISE